MIDHSQITEYRFVKVKYESQVDWSMKTDYLRCNPSFHNRSRYDFVLTNINGNLAFAQLVLIFVCRFGMESYRLALVQPLDRMSQASSVESVDNALSIHRWTIRHRNRCEVIPLDSIVRGAVLVKDPGHSYDYFVIDTLDEDMYLRVISHLS